MARESLTLMMLLTKKATFQDSNKKESYVLLESETKDAVAVLEQLVELRMNDN